MWHLAADGGRTHGEHIQRLISNAMGKGIPNLDGEDVVSSLEAVDKINEFIESCCKTILEESGGNIVEDLEYKPLVKSKQA